jgi:BlaI family transcriptional regulator, penicillinase repressor
VSGLGDLERVVMDLLWERHEPVSVRVVTRALADRDLAYTTVMTVLDRLAKKGFVRRERVGRAWQYAPAASREAYVARLMLDALDLTGDRRAALARFARSVSGQEAEILRETLTETAAERDDERGQGR